MDVKFQFLTTVLFKNFQVNAERFAIFDKKKTFILTKRPNFRVIQIFQVNFLYVRKVEKCGRHGASDADVKFAFLTTVLLKTIKVRIEIFAAIDRGTW